VQLAPEHGPHAPREITPQQFRHVLGHLPTGVTVIAGYGPDGPVGLAANSLTSVSLDPALVSFCPARSSTSWPRVRQVERFCVSVLGADHEHVSRQFARSGTDKFADIAWHERSAGPALDGAVAWIDCVLVAEHPAGDHTIAVARVLDVEAVESVDEAGALVFFRGRYGRFLGSDRI
jgi:3-hydroxy-9,10-secoandrosta-1,3,5(10)-triene-9,17-dione monooxygenase reductase component